MERGHDAPAVDPLVAAVAEDEAEDARPACRDRRQTKQLLLQWGKWDENPAR